MEISSVERSKQVKEAYQISHLEIEGRTTIYIIDRGERFEGEMV